MKTNKKNGVTTFKMAHVPLAQIPSYAVKGKNKPPLQLPKAFGMVSVSINVY